MTLREAILEKEYTVKSIFTDDEELDEFLFSLGAFAGEKVTVISRQKKTMVVAIKDGRYCIDNALAGAIEI